MMSLTGYRSEKWIGVMEIDLCAEDRRTGDLESSNIFGRFSMSRHTIDNDKLISSLVQLQFST